MGLYWGDWGWACFRSSDTELYLVGRVGLSRWARKGEGYSLCHSQEVWNGVERTLQPEHHQQWDRCSLNESFEPQIQSLFWVGAQHPQVVVGSPHDGSKGCWWCSLPLSHSFSLMSIFLLWTEWPRVRMFTLIRAESAELNPRLLQKISQGNIQ